MRDPRPGLFGTPGPRWFSIPAHRPFVDDLARGLLDQLGSDDPEALADAIVLLPTRRGARELVNAFLRASADRPLLPPQVRALGDLEEGEPPFEPGDLALDLPPAIGGHRRRFELARLAAEHEHALGRTLDVPASLDLADALAAFLDSAAIEEVDARDRLDGLTEGDHAEHWRRSADFLRVAVEAWPRRLAELGLVDPSTRRVALLRALASRWSEAPPAGVLVAAGSTGSAPATADLLAVVAAAPRGCTVLPGLDKNLADDAWAMVSLPEGAQHPQHGMARLLRRAGVPREAVRDWPASPESVGGRARRRLINEALRPAEATADWLRIVQDLRAEGRETGADPLTEGLRGLTLVTAPDEEAVAAAVALLLREALETPGRTAALVTPDQALGRRVAARLSRWDVRPDASAGAPLAGSPLGVLLSLSAALLCDPADPIAALGVLKSPLTRLQRSWSDLRRQLRTLERHGLRGARPRSWSDIRERLTDVEKAKETQVGEGAPAEARIDIARRFAEAAELVDDFEEAVADALSVLHDGAAPAPDLVRAHLALVEALASDETGRTGALWAGPEGETASRLFSALLDEGTALPPLSADDYAEVVGRLLDSETVRAGGGTHPRLRILGAIEARLVRADLLVLAGLEEGTWPAPPPTDPFLSRPMRERMGLPSPERRIGLSAHDFAQAACAPDVVLVHTERRGGQPAVKSRWLWRLETLLRGAGGMQIPSRPELGEWSRALNGPVADPPRSLLRARGPEPRPPVETRPRKLYVTQVETWVRDPYAVYARHVLGLRALARPDERVDARARGDAMHTAFEALAAEVGANGAAVAEAFVQRYLQELRASGAGQGAMAREAALATRVADWAIAWEHRRRSGGAAVFAEVAGQMAIPAPREPFVLAARADRIEVADRRAHVLDVKTGGPPSDKQVRTFFSPQLTLTAAILQAGGFADVGAKAPGDLVYVRVSGRSPPGEEKHAVYAEESSDLAQQALAGLQRLIERYEDPDQPFRSRTAPQFVRLYASHYDHLARVREWDIEDEEDRR